MNNKGADQTAHTRRLVCAFVVRKPSKTGFLALRHIFNKYITICLTLYLGSIGMGSVISCDLILQAQSTIFQLCHDRSSRNEPVLSKDKWILLKDTTQ